MTHTPHDFVPQRLYLDHIIFSGNFGPLLKHQDIYIYIYTGDDNMICRRGGSTPPWLFRRGGSDLRREGSLDQNHLYFMQIADRFSRRGGSTPPWLFRRGGSELRRRGTTPPYTGQCRPLYTYIWKLAKIEKSRYFFGFRWIGARLSKGFNDAENSIMWSKNCNFECLSHFEGYLDPQYMCLLYIYNHIILLFSI